MDQQATIEGIDAVLLPFLAARDEFLSERLLTQLICEHAEPVIRKIIKSKLRVSLSPAQGAQQNQDALEIESELRFIIFSELRELKNGPAQKSIASFPNYVAIKTYSACADYFREKNPRRWRLKNTLRHHLKHHAQFALWRGDDRRMLAGLSVWRSSLAAHDHAPSQSLNLTAEKLSAALRPGEDVRRLPPERLLAAIFELAGGPIEFDRVVAIAAEAWGIKDQPVESFEGQDGESSIELVDTSPQVDVLFEHRLYLSGLWTEVCQLPRLQRAALLLNLRDGQGGGVIAFIPHLGLASVAEIALMIGMTVEQLSALWNELPLDDARIAARLGLSRQQVINLRKTARARLARRMKALEKKD
jgi:hypothetical protein